MKALLISLAAVLSGTGFIAYAEGPSLPAGDSVPSGLIEKAIGACLILGGSLEGARRMAASAKSEARAADQRATAIGRKHDELQRDFHSEMLRRSGWEGEQRGSLEAVKDRLKTISAGIHEARTELGGRIIRLEDRFEAAQDE